MPSSTKENMCIYKYIYICIYIHMYAMVCHGICLGMPRHMPWHAMAYAMACLGICHGMPWHMPWRAMAYAMACATAWLWNGGVGIAGQSRWASGLFQMFPVCAQMSILVPQASFQPLLNRAGALSPDVVAPVLEAHPSDTAEHHGALDCYRARGPRTGIP